MVQFMENFIAKIQQSVEAYGPNLVAALLTLILGWWLAKILTGLFRRMLRRGQVDETLTGFLTHLLYIGAMVLVVITALGKLGVNTTSFAAVVAAAGLAIGFALQGSLANFAAGVMLITFRPFRVGDYVDAGGVSGTVEEIQIFATLLTTPDNKQVVLGNAAITGGSIINYSAKETRRVDLVFGISYDDDIQKAKDLLQKILDEDERILKEPAATIGVLELGESSVNFAVRPWVRTADYWGVYFALHERVKLAFDATGISIPYPQTDIHMRQAA